MKGWIEFAFWTAIAGFCVFASDPYLAAAFLVAGWFTVVYKEFS